MKIKITLISIMLIMHLLFDHCFSQNKLCENCIDSSLCYLKDTFRSSKLQLETKWESEELISSLHTPLLADMDGDCIPDFVCVSNTLDHILIIDSKTGKTKSKFPTLFINDFVNLLIADIDNDCKKEILFTTPNIDDEFPNNNYKIVCYSSTGRLIWVSDQSFYGKYIGQKLPSLAIADFNQDGIAEVYCYNRIFNARTGVFLASGAPFDGLGYNWINTLAGYHQSIAAQLDQDFNDLELASGFTVYKVKIINPNSSIGNTLTSLNIQVNNQSLDGKTAIADINQDGQLDIIVSYNSKQNTSLIYVYTIVNNNPKLLAKTINSPINTFISCTTISDINGDGRPDILITQDRSIDCYNYDGSDTLKLLWTYKFNEMDATTAITTFDFNHDGRNEIVHRGNDSIYLLDASTNPPRIISSGNCSAFTVFENCIVADIDHTGSSKICIPCASENSRYSSNGRLTVFGPPDGTPTWAPARGIWNQYAYNPLFINDDLTVPRVQKNQATYQNGKYNNFMQQESYVDSNGLVKKPAASLTGRISCINYDVKSMRYSVTFDVYNRKDASQIGDTGLLISFYSGDPNTNGTYIGIYKTDQIINAGDSLLNLVYWFQFKDLKDLFMVVNTQRVNNGNLEDKDFIQAECDYTDNVFRTIDIPKIESQFARICKGDTYSFFNQFIIDSGTYEHKIYKWNGCDSLITVLDLKTVDTVVARQSINTCDSYNWNGKKYTNSGIYSYDTLSTNGCDSSTILDLTLHLSDQKNTSLSSCDSANWNGMTYKQSGTYEDRRINLAGCDSINILQLKIHPSSNIIQSQSACDHYDWNGQTYSQSGSYFFNTKSVFGCDSNQTLQLTIDTVIQIDLNHTECNSYVWNNNTYTQSGKYQSKEQSQQGCDSITTLNLIIHPSTNSTTNIRSCNNYTWNGNTYTVSGTYSYQTQNSLGCDSIATLNLIIDKTSSSTSVQRVCDSIIWNGSTYYKSGIYSFNTINNAGCDSIATLDLTISTPSLEIIAKTTCDSIIWNGKKYLQSGLYDFKSSNQSGCDSTVRLSLTINKSITTDLKLNVCDSILFMGQVLNKTGFYTFDTVTSRGCDSAIHLQLSILSNTSSQKVSSCDSFMWNGKSYLQSGIYSEKYTNSLGCDSSFLLDLSIHPSFELKQSIDVCKEYFWPITKTLYTKSEDLLYSLKTAESCDSVYKLQLTIHPEFEKRDTIITDKEYTWPVNKTTYQQSGNYESNFISEAGCDSLHYLVLIINKDVRIYYPNIFNPNSSTNNKFTVFVYGTEAMIEELSIFDRWGELIWQKDNFPTNDINLGWDGIFHGMKVNPGVYVWKAMIRVGDGSVLREKGDVTVVR